MNFTEINKLIGNRDINILIEEVLFKKECCMCPKLPDGRSIQGHYRPAYWESNILTSMPIGGCWSCKKVLARNFLESSYLLKQLKDFLKICCDDIILSYNKEFGWKCLLFKNNICISCVIGCPTEEQAVVCASFLIYYNGINL